MVAKHFRRSRYLALVALLALFAGCARTDVLVEFEGVVNVTGLVIPIEFRFVSYGQTLRGDYFLDGAKVRTGRTEGTIAGTDLTMTIHEDRTDGCVYDFEGTINDEELEGIFEPVEDQEVPCLTGGTWELTRVY